MKLAILEHKVIKVIFHGHPGTDFPLPWLLKRGRERERVTIHLKSFEHPRRDELLNWVEEDPQVLAMARAQVGSLALQLLLKTENISLTYIRCRCTRGSARKHWTGDVPVW